MALNFTETAPGVHTSTLTNPKTEQRHNIAIIESCGAFQLFVDGELAARDLPSFKVAIAEAEAKVTTRRTPVMVRAACVLVVMSIAGASAIGVAKLWPYLGDDAAVAAVASEAKAPEAPHRFKRVGKPPAKVATRPAKPVERKVEPLPAAPVEPVTVTVPKVAEKAPAPKPLAKAPAPSTVVTEAPVAAEAPQAPETPVLGLKPIVMSKAATSPLPPVTVKRKAETPVEPEPETAIAAAPTAPEPAPRDAEPRTYETPQPAEAKDEESATPPAPAKAPTFAAPLIRPARTPIDPERLNSILANLEAEAEKSETRSVTRNRPSHADEEPRVRTKRAERRRSRRHRLERQARRARRANRYRSEEERSYRSAPSRRMVCFGGMCKFR